MIKRRRSYPL